ncbi:MAG TPA: hypothetical protein VLB07_00610 [Woeseiaceae bacterium]|nr:hypothetical protein [Woeseiaceae bacterium]
MNTRWKFAAVWLLVSVGAEATPTETGPVDLEFGASAAYRYDSNVNVADIDANTGEGDTALVMDVGIGGSLRPGQRLSLDFGYAYSGTRYQQFREFDVAIHELHGAVGYRIAGFDAGVSVDRFATRLDNESFLDITRVSPSLSRLFGERLYLRVAYAQAEKSYQALAERDAVTRSYRADAYVLLDGMKRYFAMALERDSDDALTDTLDYDGRAMRLSYGHRLEAGSVTVDVKAHARFDVRDYKSSPGDDESPRQDVRRRAGLRVGLPLGEHFEIAGQAEYSDNASTLETASYDEMVYTLTIGAGF